MEDWILLGDSYGDCYRIEPGAIETGYLCSGDSVPSFVESNAMPGPWSSLEQLRAAHERAGKYYFSPGAVSFFSARYNEVIGGRLLIDSAVESRFITSIPTFESRRYRVSVWDDDGIGCRRIGVFGTLAAARRFAREIVAAAAIGELADS